MTCQLSDTYVGAASDLGKMLNSLGQQCTDNCGEDKFAARVTTLEFIYHFIYSFHLYATFF